MYKAKLWDEDKWNIHEGYKSSKYGSITPSDKKESKAYHEQKYGSEKDISSDYMKKEDAKEKEESKKDALFEELEEEKKKEEVKEEELPFKAAKQIFSEHKNEPKREPGKKDKSTIEDAIKKAIEDEKKVIMMD
ncbi:hypothetical protein HYX06_03980 [Candidatus Woesearchaeota archaeon]|nr:hypothetical protein [Candidatus Woesearchaeota archaeon]